MTDDLERIIENGDGSTTFVERDGQTWTYSDELLGQLASERPKPGTLLGLPVVEEGR